MLESFVGKEDELNEQMRLRYKADLNGEYPDPPSESDTGNRVKCTLPVACLPVR